MTKLNIWSFIFSIISVLLFFLYSICGPIDYSLWVIHPLQLLLYFTWTIFMFGLLGFAGVENGKGMARSVITIILTLGLSIILAIIIFVGRLFS